MRRHSAVIVAEMNPMYSICVGSPASFNRFKKSLLFQKLVMKETGCPFRTSPWPNSKAMTSFPETYPAPQTINIGEFALPVILVSVTQQGNEPLR
jgi:hypothetical protein